MLRLLTCWAAVCLCVGTLAACGDDDDESREGAPPIAGGGSSTGGECNPGFTQSPAPACDCEMGWRTCDDDGTWMECVCPDIDPCRTAIGWRCDPCPGETEDRILQCVDGEPPTCECPDDEDDGDDADAG